LQAISPELTFYNTSKDVGVPSNLSNKLLHAQLDAFARCVEHELIITFSFVDCYKIFQGLHKINVAETLCILVMMLIQYVQALRIGRPPVWAYNRRKYVQAIFSIFIMILIIVCDGSKSLLLCHVLYFINFYIYLFVIFKNLLVFMYFSCYCCLIVFNHSLALCYELFHLFME
jgi:hypothetical protein